MNPLRVFRNLRFWTFYRLITRRGTPLVTLGGVASWTIWAGDLGPASRVLCAGAGDDISFEKALVARYGCQVVLMDPSPPGISTIQSEDRLDQRLRFIPAGLAGRDGTLSFEDPNDPSQRSFRAVERPQPGAVQFPCRSLPSLMREFGWSGIDLLKMDIEGCEYEVIDQILREKLEVRQFCVEFHHRPPFGHTRGETIRAILNLRRAGFDLVHRIHSDHTFLRRAAAGNRPQG